MSVEIVGDLRGTLCANPPRTVTNLLVFFGGYDSELNMSAGNPLTQTDRHGKERTSFSAFQDLQRAYFSWPSMAKGIDPDLRYTDYNRAVVEGERFIHSHFHPLGRLVIYGFSAGGFLALKLCERIWNYRRWYNFSTGNIGGGLTFTPAPNDPQYGRVNVDLLVTVDPCMEDSRDPIRPTRAPGVRRHENFRQNQPRSTRSEHYWGASLPGANDHPNEHPQVEPGQGWHDAMPMHTLPRVRQLIENDLRLQGTCYVLRT